MQFYNILFKKSIILLVLGMFLPSLVLARIPNDPSFSQQPFHQKIHSTQAWDYSIGSRDVIVAVIDIGVDINHPDLKDNIWINKNEIDNNGIDDDENGFIDDIHGWNFVDNNPNVGLVDISSSTEIDLIGHGTIVSGIIGAVGGNNLYSTGINWRVSIMPIKAINNDGEGSFVNVAKAVDYAVDNGADVINLSIVSENNSKILQKVIERAWQKGIVVVAAAGNEDIFTKGNLDNNPAYPVCFDSNSVDNYILGVGSLDKDNQLSNFSSYGSCVDVSAWGENMNSTLYYSSSDGLNSYFGGNTNGTSFSTPQVSGTAALLKSIIPSWNAHEINNFIIKNSKDISTSNLGWEKDVGRGLDTGNIIKASVNTVAYLRDSIKYFYYQKGNHIYVYNTLTKTVSPFDHVSNEKLVDFTLYDVNNDGEQEIILLLKRSQFYYLQINDNKGSLIKEYVLPREQNTSGNYLHLDIIGQKDKIYYVLESAWKNKRYLDKFDSKIKLLSSVEYSGQKWSATTNYAYYGDLRENNLTITKKDWQGNKVSEYSFDNIKEWLDFSVRDILDWSGDELILLVNSNNNIQSWIVDDTQQATRQKILQSAQNNNDDWYLLFNPLNNLLWPVNLSGGIFPLLKNGYEWVGEKEITKISEVSKVVLVK